MILGQYDISTIFYNFLQFSTLFQDAARRKNIIPNKPPKTLSTMTVIIKSQSPIVFYDAETREIHQIHSFSKDGRNALSGFLISLDRRISGEIFIEK